MDHSTGSFIARGGVTVFTQTWRPEAPPRARVVLVHGFGEHSGRYTHVAEALTAAGYVVATYDQRGHGRSGGPRALVRDMPSLAHDLSLFREELADTADGALPQVLLGHSMGGAVVLEHLAGDHAPVEAVVLSAPYVRNAAEVPGVLRTLAPILGRFLPTAPTQGLPAETVSRDPAVVRAYEDDPLVFHGKIPAATGATLLQFEDRIMRRVGSITEPTLVVHGTADQLADPAGSRRLADELGGQVELKLYEGLYHEVFNEPEQERVLADVTGYLLARLG
ncbi:alpha/beta hydrolase [Euzebya rosea]|uniref:alpha/beta hydrolase n=1 Tax=Euzebya rosea TaxID=2052804 RepID=UPI000D3E9449|nr:alpha/beta hydrolase [Euzebya rosea]